jgi:glycosyltransferase involved in cell wall biosynthesis
MEPIVSVIIPTRDRPDSLARTLHALTRQTVHAGCYEVLVVDDGSRASTREALESVRRASHARLKYLRQPAAGPAAARNAGIRSTRAPLLLLLGDDIVAKDDLVEQHVAWHRQFPALSVAVLGHVTWSPELAITPYMRWLERSGQQFDYGSLANQEADPGRYFYTANVSVKRGFLLACAEFFDESFRHAAYEDIELGCRLAVHGLVLKYNQRAAAYHHHATSVISALTRARRCGESSVVFERKSRRIPRPRHAGVLHHLMIARIMAACAWRVIVNWPCCWLARLCETRLDTPRIYTRAHACAAHAGILGYYCRRIGPGLRRLV